jgi:hypothetical protein
MHAADLLKNEQDALDVSHGVVAHGIGLNSVTGLDKVCGSSVVGIRSI